MVNIFGAEIPLWIAFIIGIIVVIIAWKLVKFALTILIVLVIFLVILFGLDFLGVFDTIQGFFSTII
jgi:hypothetical protein